MVGALPTLAVAAGLATTSGMATVALGAEAGADQLPASGTSGQFLSPSDQTVTPQSSPAAIDQLMTDMAGPGGKDLYSSAGVQKFQTLVQELPAAGQQVVQEFFSDTSQRVTLGPVQEVSPQSVAGSSDLVHALTPHLVGVITPDLAGVTCLTRTVFNQGTSIGGIQVWLLSNQVSWCHYKNAITDLNGNVAQPLETPSVLGEEWGYTFAGWTTDENAWLEQPYYWFSDLTAEESVVIKGFPGSLYPALNMTVDSSGGFAGVCNTAQIPTTNCWTN